MTPHLRTRIVTVTCHLRTSERKVAINPTMISARLGFTHHADLGRLRSAMQSTIGGEVVPPCDLCRL